MWYSFSTPDEPLPCRYVVPLRQPALLFLPFRDHVPNATRVKDRLNAQTAFVYPRHYRPFSLISPRNRPVPSRFAALLVKRGSIVRSVLGNDESTSVKLASRFRFEVLRMSPFTTFRREIVLERRSTVDPRWTDDRRTDRPTGRIRFGERDRTAGARLRRLSSAVPKPRRR